MNTLRIIDRQTYLNILERQPQDVLKDVDINQYSDYYYSLETIEGAKAVCGIHDQKNEIRQVNGLVSLEKGYGKILLNAIIAKYLRLNCTRKLYNKFYSEHRFEVYLELGDYIECMRYE